MPDTLSPGPDDLLRRVAELEAELERLRPIEAAAREAHAFFSGRRPGFAPGYPRDILRAALEPDKPARPAKARPRRRTS